MLLLTITAQVGLGMHQEAVDACLAIIKADKSFNNGAARTLLLKEFENLGATHPITLAGRKQLSKLLFR